MSIVGGNQNDAAALLWLIASDPKKFQDEIKRLEEAKQAAEEKLKKIAKAGDIDAMHRDASAVRKRADEMEARASQILSKANDEAAAVLANANAFATAARARADEDAKRMRDSAERTVVEAEKKMNEAVAAIGAADKRAQELSRMALSLNERVKAADEAKAKATVEIEKFMARRAAMEKSMKDIAGALAVTADVNR